MTSRRFTGYPAVRSSVPLWIGLYGPSGSGKTYSALRLARGIQSVTGGLIGCGDTENGRATHYASEFQFQHYPFEPPFDPQSYLDLLHQMVADGVTVGILDSASHEWDGEGGVLEMHQAETERLAKAWNVREDKAQMSAWKPVKAAHNKFWRGALRLPIHLIWCFRGKEKLSLDKGKQPTTMGYMPISGSDLVFEMTLRALLLPGAYGHPTWDSKEKGEREMIKLPHWAKALLRSGVPLDEELGAALANWARGDGPEDRLSELLAALAGCDAIALPALEESAREMWRSLSAREREAVKTAVATAKARIKEAP